MEAPNSPVSTATPCAAQGTDERLVERLGLRAPERALETGPAAAREIRAESELGDDEDASAHVGEGEIHLPRLVVEDTQTGDLARGLFGEPGGVSGLRTEEHQESSTDLAHDAPVDAHRGARDTLDDELHLRRFRAT